MTPKYRKWLLWLLDDLREAEDLIEKALAEDWEWFSEFLEPRSHALGVQLAWFIKDFNRHVLATCDCVECARKREWLEEKGNDAE